MILRKVRKAVRLIRYIIGENTAPVQESNEGKPNCPILPVLNDGRGAEFIFKNRIKIRYRDMRKKYPNLPVKTFEELFGLPDWLSLNDWLTVNLRGRPVEFMLQCNTDHIVPMGWAHNEEEIIKLFSYKNTRLLDPDLNGRKSDYLDEENRELCFTLLGRYPKNKMSREVLKPKITDPKLMSKWEKLMSRGNGYKKSKKKNRR